MRAKVIIGFAMALLAVWANNASLLSRPGVDLQPLLLSHRGVHQHYAGAVLEHNTCTARPIEPPQHSFLENTIPSMRAAFEKGADVIELDVHLTPDNVLAVFHDWRLECRTDGDGQTTETPYALIKTLDAGYGYTVDGETYPFRGNGVGLIPTLPEVFDAFPDSRFLINFKSNRSEEGAALSQLLAKTSAYRAQVFGVYGGEQPTRVAMSETPGLKGYDRRSIKECVFKYAAIGWSGYVPKVCRNRILALPINYAHFMWGWPYRFEERFRKAGAPIILLGPYNGEGFSSGIDDRESFSRVPQRFSGYVWTNRIEDIGPVAMDRRKSEVRDNAIGEER